MCPNMVFQVDHLIVHLPFEIKSHLIWNVGCSKILTIHPSSRKLIVLRKEYPNIFLFQRRFGRQSFYYDNRVQLLHVTATHYYIVTWHTIAYHSAVVVYVKCILGAYRGRERENNVENQRDKKRWHGLDRRDNVEHNKLLNNTLQVG